MLNVVKVNNNNNNNNNSNNKNNNRSKSFNEFVLISFSKRMQDYHNYLKQKALQQ